MNPPNSLPDVAKNGPQIIGILHTFLQRLLREMTEIANSWEI